MLVYQDLDMLSMYIQMLLWYYLELMTIFIERLMQVENFVKIKAHAKDIQQCGYLNTSQSKLVYVLYFFEICICCTKRLGGTLVSVSISIFVFSSVISNGTMCCRVYLL